MNGSHAGSPDAPEPGEGLEPGSPLEPLLGGDARGDAWMDLVRASETPRTPGRIGPYEIVDEVRSGGQGVVFRARESGSGRTVALKRLAAGSLATPAMRRRFERELEAVSGLAHPGIVRVHGVEAIGGEPLLSMEWIEGEPLTRWARRIPAGRDGLRAKLGAFLEVCDAVQHAHQRGVIHRDLKPSNVLVDAAGRCHVLDFGLARRLPVAGHDDATRTVGFVGTPAYAAPEHFTEGEAPLDARSDVYSLGVVLHEVLTGTRPFAQSRLRDLIEAIERHEPPRPSSLAPGLARDLDTIVAKAMAKRPERRYQSVHALADDVRRFLGGRPVLAAPQSALYVLGRWVRRNRLAAGALAALLATIVASAVVGIRQAARIADERDRARLEARKARVVQGFYLESIIEAATPTRSSESTDVVAVLEQAIPLLDTRFSAFPTVAIQIRAQLARAFSAIGRDEEADELARTARESLAALGVRDPATEALLDHYEGGRLGDLGKMDEAVPILERAAANYRSVEDPSEVRGALCSVLFTLAQAERNTYRWESAERHASEAAGLAESLGKTSTWINARTVQADVLTLSGRSEEAEVVLLEVLARVEGTPIAETLAGSRLYSALAELYRQRDDCAAALTWRRKAAAISARFYPAGHPGQGEDVLALGLALAECGAHAEALECFERVVSLDNDRYFVALALRGQADCQMGLGDPDRAADLYRRAWESLCEVSEPVERTRLETAVHRVEALVAAGRLEDARAAEADLELEIARSGHERGFLRAPFVERARISAHRIGLSEGLDRALTEMVIALESGDWRDDVDFAGTAEAVRAPISALVDAAAKQP